MLHNFRNLPRAGEIIIIIHPQEWSKGSERFSTIAVAFDMFLGKKKG
jgi:hypothetical protein